MATSITSGFSSGPEAQNKRLLESAVVKASARTLRKAEKPRRQSYQHLEQHLDSSWDRWAARWLSKQEHRPPAGTSSHSARKHLSEALFEKSPGLAGSQDQQSNLAEISRSGSGSGSGSRSGSGSGSSKSWNLFLHISHLHAASPTQRLLPDHVGSQISYGHLQDVSCPQFCELGALEARIQDGWQARELPYPLNLRL